MSKFKETSHHKKLKSKFSWILITLLSFLVLATFIISYKFKGLVVVATVNNKPIYSWKFLNYLWHQYGQWSLEEMINQRLLAEEENELQIQVSDQEIQTEIERIIENQGGQEELEKLLQKQDLTYQEFQERVKTQLTIDKILEKQISISQSEVEAYIRRYQMQMEATDEASRRIEARDIIKLQKISEAYQTFFEQLKEKNQVKHFLRF